jgi:hypothetical protein
VGPRRRWRPGLFFDDETSGLDRFGPLLTLTVATLAGLMLVDLDSTQSDDVAPLVSALVSLSIGATLLLALRASGASRRTRRLAIGAMAVMVTLTLVSLITELVAGADVLGLVHRRPSPLWIPFAVITPITVTRRLLRHRRVTVQILEGAIAAYLLIALGFAYIFLHIDAITENAFFTEELEPGTTSFAYFSLVTITTLGYGDLSPANDFSRLLATSEAIIGQVYLVTVVAVIVGLFIGHRESAGEGEARPREHGADRDSDGPG